MSMSMYEYVGMCIRGRHTRIRLPQAACPVAAFDVLREDLGVSSELFASPLNCRFPRFCSAAADADEPFGSVGSFFDCDLRSGARRAAPPPPPPRPAPPPRCADLAPPCNPTPHSPWQPSAPLNPNPDPKPGAYLANPPFDPTVVERMIIRMEELLGAADQAHACPLIITLTPAPAPTRTRAL